jgi:hypothetical protein
VNSVSPSHHETYSNIGCSFIQLGQLLNLGEFGLKLEVNHESDHHQQAISRNRKKGVSVSEQDTFTKNKSAERRLKEEGNMNLTTKLDLQFVLSLMESAFKTNQETAEETKSRNDYSEMISFGMNLANTKYEKSIKLLKQVLAEQKEDSFMVEDVDLSGGMDHAS